MDKILFLKLLFAALTIFFTMVNIARAVGNLRIPFANFFWQTVGIIGSLFMFTDLFK